MKLATLPSKLRRYWSLPRAERDDLLYAAAALIRAKLRVRRVPLGELIERDAVAGNDLPAPEAATSERVGMAVNRIANHLPIGATCLVRSLAIQRLFLRRGYHPGELHVGVRMSDGAFEAHAWVTQNGRVVGDDPARVAKFTPVSDLGTVRF